MHKIKRIFNTRIDYYGNIKFKTCPGKVKKILVVTVKTSKTTKR